MLTSPSASPSQHVQRPTAGSRAGRRRLRRAIVGGVVVFCGDDYQEATGVNAVLLHTFQNKKLLHSQEQGQGQLHSLDHEHGVSQEERRHSRLVWVDPNQGGTTCYAGIGGEKHGTECWIPGTKWNPTKKCNADQLWKCHGYKGGDIGDPPNGERYDDNLESCCEDDGTGKAPDSNAAAGTPHGGPLKRFSCSTVGPADTTSGCFKKDRQYNAELDCHAETKDQCHAVAGETIK
eukprot:g418.t1